LAPKNFPKGTSEKFPKGIGKIALQFLQAKIPMEFFLFLDTNFANGKISCLWSEGKFYRSVGNTTADVVKHYIACSQGDWSNVLRVSEFSDLETDLGQSTLSDWLV